MTKASRRDISKDKKIAHRHLCSLDTPYLDVLFLCIDWECVCLPVISFSHFLDTLVIFLLELGRGQNVATVLRRIQGIGRSFIPAFNLSSGDAFPLQKYDPIILLVAFVFFGGGHKSLVFCFHQPHASFTSRCISILLRVNGFPVPLITSHPI